MFTINDKKEIQLVKDGYETYTIPKEVKGIINGTQESYAFQNVTSEEFCVDFDVDCELTYIGSYSFYHKENLVKINFENAKKLEIIYERAFLGCSSLTSIKFPSSLKIIRGWGAFELCGHLTNVEFPQNSELEIIEDGSFQNTGLTTFHVPKNCRFIHGEAFGYCNIISFTVDDDNSYFKVHQNSLYSFNFNKLIFQARGNTMELHEDTTTIGWCAFKGYSYPLTFPDMNINFESTVFYGYQGTIITFHCAIITTSQRMFENCPNLKIIYFNNKLDTIAASVFKRTYSLRYIYLSNPIKEISAQDFPNLHLICFSGCVDSVRQILTNYNVKDCFFLVKTCIHQIPTKDNTFTLYIMILYSSNI